MTDLPVSGLGHSSSIVPGVMFYNMYLLLWLQEVGILENGCDILLVNSTKEETERVRASGRFGKIILYESRPKGVELETYSAKITQTLSNRGRIYRTKMDYLKYFKPKYFTGGAVGDYDKFYYGHPQMAGMTTSLWLYDDLYKGNPIEISSWEHGNTSYGLYDYPDWPRLSRFGLAMQLLGIGPPREKCLKINVFRPDLVTLPNIEDRIVRVPPLDRDNSAYVATANSVHGFRREFLSNLDGCDCVLFDQVLDVNEQFLPKMLKVLDIFSRHIPSERLLVKLHPRCVSSPYPKRRTLQDHMPWELYTLNMPRTDDMVFFTINSNALFSPKLYFDDEPYLIYMGEMFSVENPILEKVRSIYRNPEKVFMPRTFEEFEQALVTIREMKNSSSGPVGKGK